MVSKGYDPELFNDYVIAIKTKRGITFKQYAAYLGVSVYALYRARKGKRKTKPNFYNTVESNYEEVFEKYYVLILIQYSGSSPFYLIKMHVKRTYQGALNTQAGYELHSTRTYYLVDSLIEVSSNGAKAKILKWLNEYGNEIYNRQEAENMVQRLISYQAED